MSFEDFDPPNVLLKRLETLENPAKPPITIFKHKGKLSSLKTGLGPEDMHIIERLEKLKEDRKIHNIPSESELNQRLLNLKGLNTEFLKKKQKKLEVTQKTEIEEVNELLQQYMDEADLEQKMCVENEKNLQDIEARLQRLHTSGNSETCAVKKSVFEEDDDSVSKAIIQRAIAEGKLEKKLEDSVSNVDRDEDFESADKDEDMVQLWCIICNENGALKCLGCDGSIYCDSCFEQGHEFFEMLHHKIIKFVNK